MPTIIDSLIVEFGLDPTKFTAGQKTAVESFKKLEASAKKTGTDVEEAGKKAAEFYTGLKNAAIGLFAVIAGSDMIRFARDTMTTVAATGRLAHNIGASAKDLATFASVVELNGGNADEAAASMQNLTQQAENFRVFGQASQEFQIALGTIGASADMTALQDYMRFADWASHHRNDPQLVNLIGRQLGLDQGSINAALNGSEQLAAQYRKMQDLAPSQQDVNQLTALQQSWLGLDRAVEAVGRDLLVGVSGPLSTIFNGLSQWMAANRSIADEMAAILGIFSAIFSLKPAAWFLKLLGIGGGITTTAPAAALTMIGGGSIAGAIDTLNRGKAGQRPTYIDPYTGIPTFGGEETAAFGSNRSVAMRAKNFFMAQGWTNAQAAAIVANAQAESSLNAIAGRGTAHQGLFQWDSTRRNQILAGTGIDVWNSSFADQLKAAQWELTHTESKSGAGLLSFNDPGAAAVYLDRSFERSGDTAVLEQHRALLASSLATMKPSQTVPIIDSDVHIGQISVVTQATDADGISKSIGGAVRRQMSGDNGIAVQANQGLN